MTLPFAHKPVLCRQIVDHVIDAVGDVSDPLLIDGTVGGGGHSAALLSRLPRAELLGIDRDEEALSAARRNLEEFAERVDLVHGTFDRISAYLQGRLAHVVLVDVGVSSYQLDAPQRGFSFRQDAPLDMRMDQGSGETLADRLGALGQVELEKLIREYGEERFAGRIARSIVEDQPQTTMALARSIYRVYPKRARAKMRIDPATRTFQALRIYINDELGQLERWLTDVPNTLAVGGVALAISFHSLEDRLVKRGFQRLAGRCICPAEVVQCQCAPPQDFELLHRRPIVAEPEEAAENPRARSAKLRLIRRLPPASPSARQAMDGQGR